MKKIFRRIAAGVMAGALAVGTLTGCGKSESMTVKDTKYEISDNSEVVFDFGKSTITYGELLYFISYFEMTGEYQREYYAENMGYTGDFWSELDENGNPESANYKSQAFQMAAYVEVMKNAAIDAGITLDENDLADVKKTTEESINIFPAEDLPLIGITYEGFESAQKTIAYTNKYVESLRNEYRDSDKVKEALSAIKREDYQAYDVNYAYITKAADGEAGNAALLNLINEIHDKAVQGTEFTELEALYVGNSAVTLGSKVVPKNDSTLDAAITGVLAKMNRDDVSDVIDTDYGYFVFQMINTDTEELYLSTVKENENTIIDSMITARYSELNEEYTIDGNEELCNSIKMGSTTINYK